jgi:hypothetical protein
MVARSRKRIGIRSGNVSFVLFPARAEIANKTPRKSPTGQVAYVPHPKPSRVGDCV